MKEWLISIDSALPTSLVGRKAAALGQLVEAGFPVPASLCITTNAFFAAPSAKGELRLPAGLMEDLTCHLAIDTPLAVRSSALQEDRPDTSLAGRYATYLNVSGESAMERAILDIWRSYLTVQSDMDTGGMAVLIQPLIDAECAGVCFTVDPVRSDPKNLLVVAGWGLGAGVVSGSVPTDTIRFRRQDLQAEHVSITNKQIAMRPAATGGVTSVAVSSERSNIPCLPDGWLRRIGEYGLCIEQVFGTPQDIEWAISEERVWILQSRPMTALPDKIRDAVRFPIRWDNTEEPRHYWWLQQARDSTGTPLLPSELDFSKLSIRGGHDAVYFGGINQTRWRKEVNGRVYWTVASPPHSAGHSRVYRAALLERYERLKLQGVTPWEYGGPEVISATRRLAAFDARGADGPALADHLEDAVATSIRHWMEHTIGPGRPIRDTELLDVYARMTGLPLEEAASEIPFLLSGAETIQTRLVECLYDLACLAMEFPDEAKAISINNGDLPSSISPPLELYANTVQRLFSEYGDRLSYRTVLGYPVEIPLTWREFPEHVWEMIGAYMPLAERGGPGPREIRMQTKNAADQRIESLCVKAKETGTDPELIEDFRRKLTYSRRNAFSLDEHNHYIDQLSEGQFVQALLYAGRWLAAQGLIPGPFDVFWLEVDEVLSALRGLPADLEEILRTRRAKFEEWKVLFPPPCLGLPDPRLGPRPADPVNGQPNPDPSSLPANTLAGEPASRGQASGRAHISNENTLPADITTGDILVIPYANPNLIPLLPAVAGVVLDYGGPGDHFAITAREFGLPAICGTIHATRLIPEGAQVTLDADAGIVTWV